MKYIAAIAIAILTVGCAEQRQTSKPAETLASLNAREIKFPNYPQAGNTYLSFSQAHGYQVNYLAPKGQAWLWYPGNKAGVFEEYKLDVISGQKAICWRHPSKSYNPVTKTRGGSFACQSLALSQRLTIAVLPGDPFSLKSGNIPYRLKRCTAPEAFKFDRQKFSC